MAQFGKHLYGSSFFGKSNAFVGNYDTRVIDIGEQLNGKVVIQLDSKLPSVFYKNDDALFKYSNNPEMKETHSVIKKNTKLNTYISGKNLEIHHGSGSAKVTVQEQETGEKKEYTTDDTGLLKLDNFPTSHLESYIIIIEATEDFEFKGIKAQTTEIQGLFRAAGEEAIQTENFFNQDWPLLSGNNIVPPTNSVWKEHFILDFNEYEGEVIAHTKDLTGIRYVQLRLMLLSTDSETTPEIDTILLYSGDLSRFRSSGNWRVSLDMNNIAEEKGVEFERVEKIDWIEKEVNSSRFDLHSSSRVGTTPSVLNILNDNYWSDMTAKYTLRHNGETFGIPYGRASLNEEGNGHSQSSRIGSLFLGPINTRTANFTNATILDWRKLNGLIYYPRNSNQSNFIVEFYENENDVQQGIPPVYTISNPTERNDKRLNINNRYQSLYMRILFERKADFGSPVVDDIHLYTLLKYKSLRQAGQFTDKLSALDGFEQNNTIGEGRKLVRRIPLKAFDWPSSQRRLSYNKNSIDRTEKRLDVEYTPKYLNQVYLGLYNPDSASYTFIDNEPEELEIHSQVYADTPSLSLSEVPANRISYHYNYSGGTVNFPLVTERELSTQYTPMLNDQKRYKFYIKNGWSDETFTVPYTMSFGEIADITLSDKEELISINKNTPLYDNMVLTGYELLLPNKTENELITIKFKETNDFVTEFSLLNDLKNDIVEASIEKSDSYKYQDWTSDEVVFSGFINLGDKKMPYIRTQNTSYNAEQTGNHIVSKSSEAASEIAEIYNVDLEDLIIANNKQAEYEENKNATFLRNETVVIPGKYSLPDIAPGLIYEGENPYVLEIIPGSVKRVKDNIRLPDSTLTPGSEDEPAVSYTLTESSTQTENLIRGEVANGRDPLPYSNVVNVHEIRSLKTGQKYLPATDSSGDFNLKENYIDWTPSHSNSQEPEPGEEYQVVFTRGVVDRLRIIYSSNYNEKMSLDRMEAIPVYSEEHQVDLKEDLEVTLPPLDEMSKVYPYLKNLRYVARNSDIWVNNTIDKNIVRLSLNGEDPKLNWYPTIKTGFYYLNNQEHYLYSRPIETVYGDKDIPVIRNLEYTEKGISVPIRKDWENYSSNNWTVFSNKKWEDLAVRKDEDS